LSSCRIDQELEDGDVERVCNQANRDILQRALPKDMKRAKKSMSIMICAIKSVL